MKSNLARTITISLFGSLLVSCNSGTGNQTITPQNQTVEINGSELTQYANPNILTSTSLNSSSKVATSCLTATDLAFSSSSTVWYMSGSFKINNTCTSSEQIAGIKVILVGGKTNDSWTGGAFSVNSFSPWLGSSPNYTTATNANQLILTINNTYNLAANQSITANFGYARNNVQLTTTGATIAIGGGITPTPTPTPTPSPSPTPATTVNLNIAVNSSALGSTCTQSKPCSITINLLNSNGSIYKNITTITNSTGSNNYSLQNLTPASYTLSVNGLPSNATASYTPSNVVQLTAGQTAQAGVNLNLTNPVSNCLSTTMNALSTSAWWVSGSFTVNNSCNTIQQLKGTTIAVNSSSTSDIISNFQVNSTSPYFADFASVITSSNTALLTVVNGSATIAANGSLNVSFGYSPQGKLLTGSLNASVNGATPVADSSLQITVDSSGIANYCKASAPCNIPVVLSSQNGSFSKTLTTITTTTGKSIFNISNLNTGTYILSSNNLPTDLIGNYTPSSNIQLAAGESRIMSVNYSIKPATTGTLNFTVINPQASLFTQESIPITIAGANGSTSIQAKFGQAQAVTLTAGSYSLSLNGLASASKGVYYKYSQPATNISVNNTTAIGNIIATIESNLVTNTININGLAAGDNVTLAFSDNKYAFNTEILTSTNESVTISNIYKFINGDTVTLNIITSNKYQTIAPLTISVAANKSYTINLAKVQTPSQQIVGYFETWMARATWESATYSLAKIPAYVGIIPIAFAKPDSTYTAGSYNYTGAGLGITATKDVTLGAIKLAQAKGQKLLLSVGGATYPNFGAINVPALMSLVKDLGIDGIDLDYEADTSGCSNLNTNSLSCPTDSQMINIINQLRSGLDQIQASTGRKMYLTAAVWSIGAYGTPGYPTTQYGPVGSKTALWVNPLKQVGSKFDMLFLMSYDAGNASTTGYRPLDALKAYKALYSGPVYLGVEVPPEAWGGNVTTPDQALSYASSAVQLGGAGTMIWALQLQGNANGIAVNSMSYLQPICRLYNLPNCDQAIPLN